MENHDLDIGDRDAVAGGFYLPNDGSGNQAIWFPVYNLRETAVVNFIHCLILAYMGPAMPAYNAWSEGFARAGTTFVVRQGIVPNENPPLESDLLQSVLDNSYDNSALYDWYNQPPLGNNKFIADNLRDIPLPIGGSLGGIFLMRYRQAGTAWAKFIDPYGPGFFAAFLANYYPQYTLDNSAASNAALLKQIAQSTMDTLNGGPNATIEGQSFQTWCNHQYILDTSISLGKKMFVEPIPITSGLSSTDFGVFAIWATYFETLAQGNEKLLSGTCYPIFWNPDYNRIYPEGQNDRMEIGGAFGEVTPNLTDDFGGDFYRATVELPVSDIIGRALLPAGAIATASNPIPNTFFGTVMGFDGTVTGGDPNVTGKVRITFLDLPNTAPIETPIQNGAFGTTVGTAFDTPRRLKIEVVKTDTGVDTTLLTRFVNSWGPTLGLDLRLVDDLTWQPLGGLAGGVQSVGFPVTPYDTNMASNLGLPPDQTLVARWRQDLFRYEFYPSMAPFQAGRGYFIRMPAAAANFSIFGRSVGPQPISVALQPGWNLICNPYNFDLSFSNATIQHTVDLPESLDDAVVDSLIDSTFFTLTPGAPDTFSGVPEGGTLDPIIDFRKGMAFYIRVLAPEGVTITFRPNSFAVSSNPPPLRYDWNAVLLFAGNKIEHSSVVIGTSRDATNGWDKRYDAMLPPIWGGALQAQIGTTTPMYRDIRKNVLQTWKIRLTGLKPGTTYTLKPSLQDGERRVPILVFDDGRRKTQMRNGVSITFTARSAQQDFTIWQASQ